MANQNIDVFQEILNKIDSELIALSRSTLDAQGIISMLKFLSKTLRETQEPFTKH